MFNYESIMVTKNIDPKNTGFWTEILWHVTHRKMPILCFINKTENRPLHKEYEPIQYSHIIIQCVQIQCRPLPIFRFIWIKQTYADTMSDQMCQMSPHWLPCKLCTYQLVLKHYMHIGAIDVQYMASLFL